MQEADINRFLQNALDQANAQHEEQLKELEEKLTMGGCQWPSLWLVS